MDVNIQKALNDKLYDRRKGGALELEGTVREALLANDHDRIQKIVHQLCHDYAYAVHQPHARNGGLIGLAAASIALGPEVARYLDEVVPPVLACFSDQDARVRYYACESMYNIAKVAKGEILVYYNQVFDALCKLAADAELSVKNGAELLDRLVKDIVSESAATYVSVLTPGAGAGDTDSNHDATSIEVPRAFSLSRFIPLLQQRIYVLNPFTRTFLVSWITLLDSIPDLELVSYLPSFLGGLFKFLSDPNQDVHTSTQTALEKFLTEIKKIARIKRGIAESRKSQGEDGPKPSSSSTKSEKSAKNEGSEENASPSAQVTQDGDEEFQEIDSTSTGSDTANDDKPDSLEWDWVPGQDVQVDHPQILDILVTFLHDSTEEEIQLTTLRWIDSFFEICPEDILPFVPRLLSQVLPAMSSDVEQVRQAANRVNTSLTEYIMSLSEEPSKAEPVSSGQALLPPPAGSINKDNSAAAERRDSNSAATKLRKTGSLDTSADMTTRAHVRTPTPVEESAPSPQPTMDLDYEAAVGTLTLHFLNEHEATRVAALQWLAMLHRKAPRKILAMNDGVFPALLKTLSDPAESVVTRDLLLLSQISKNSDDSYFAAFMVDLLKLFCTDRRLLETRGNLIIRQLCVTLSAERIYRTLADCLEKDDDVEFASIMIQNLNNNLITAPELADLRKRLRNLETKDGQTFFVALFRSWCHNAVATFSLCLLAQAYEQAYNLLQIFAELEMTVNMLIQIDKLVQLLESPVFTYLRLQLLEPEKFPHLYKCLYGVLMLLPQSSAFAALKNRLNSVSAIGYLHIAPRAYVPQPSTSSSSSISSMSLYHARHKSSDTPPSSNSSTPGVSSFERGPNRLKARDEGGIKWNELLEKFKTTQERARRAQRTPMFGDDLQPTQEKEKKPAAEQLASKEIQGKLQRPGSAGSATRAPPAAVQPGHAKAKSSLSNLGRFTGGVGARKAKR